MQDKEILEEVKKEIRDDVQKERSERLEREHIKSLQLDITLSDFSQMSYLERSKLYREYPKAYDRLINESNAEKRKNSYKL